MQTFAKIGMLALVGMALVPAAQAEQAQTQETAPAPALTEDAYVTVSGSVGEIVDADEFTLNHAGGKIRVDTNDYWANLFRKDAVEVLKPGDTVTVTGVVDDNFFTKKEIDATRILHKGKDYSRVYRSAPEDGYWPYYGWGDGMYGDDVSVSGTVSKILSDDEFELKYGTGVLKVDVGALEVSETDRLRQGDRVTVYGDMDDNWFGKRELDADYLVRTHVYRAPE
jgi:uncharacterized protein YdeI (BOF family)